jgi:uncharacterized protein (DUF305 family)
MQMRWVVGAALVAMAGCGAETSDAEGDLAALDTTTTQAPGPNMTPGTEGMMRGQQTPAADADHEFLRMMSDHHEGLEVMGADAMNRAVDDSVKTAAHNLHTKQAAQQDTMVAMIQRMYNEQHAPTIMPKNAAQADSLQQMSGADADRYFLRTTIAHHQEGIGMIDRFLPRFTKPEVRQMAERMREEQQRETQELQGKLSQM